MAACPVSVGLGWLAPLALALLLVVPVGPAGPLAKDAPQTSAEVLRPCGPCAPSERAAGSPSAAILDWQNVTAERFGNLPPASAGASMVYDVGANDNLWFGGCADAGCTGNQTWLFANGSWTNETGNLSLTPPARAGAMTEYLEYLPQENSNGVPLLFGGDEPGPSGTTVLGNDTWLYQDGAWTNVTQPCPCLPGLSYGSLAFDPVANVSLLFGGCVASPSCADATGASWKFDAKSSAWVPVNLTGPSARYGAAMAYDPDLQAIVLFGGAGPCGSGTCPESDTWTYTTTGWTNVTTTFGGSAPSARVDGTMIWDAASHELLLAGGSSSAGGLPTNSTYALACPIAGSACNWTGPLAAAGTGLTLSAAAANATGLDPMVVGGVNASGQVSNATWVFSALPDLNVGVTPSRPEVSQPVDLNATAVGSIDPAFAIHWGDGTTETSATGLARHVYAKAGTFDVEVAVTDPNGSANLHLLGVLVVPAPEGSIVVEFPTVDVGVSDYFTAVPALATGAPPFNFTWNFGAPPTEYGPSVRRTFTVPGPLTVVVAILDSDGLHGSNATTVVVTPDPSVNVTPQYTVAGVAVAERGVPVSLLAHVASGSGPFNLTWDFGDGSQGWGVGPSHVFSTTAATVSVRVDVLDSGGGSASADLVVHIVAPLAVQRLAESPATPTSGSSVQFTVDLTGGAGAETFAWSFGDGATATGVENVSHTYGTAGTFIAKVSVDDGAGGEAQAQISVPVTASPAAAVVQVLSDPWVVLGLGAVVVGVVAVYVRRRSSRSGPPPDAPENPP
ncbi:MAG: PKD domain-containing protein [Thermoplasmata archaeon]|nr:PKD domain-containing protein [Thermoplasmata archaeon]